MKSLADLRRACTVGTIFHCDHHERPAVGGKRTIVKVQTTGIWYEPSEGSHKGLRCWNPYGKATDLVFVGTNTVTFLNPATRTPKFTYAFPTEAPR